MTQKLFRAAGRPHVLDEILHESNVDVVVFLLLGLAFLGLLGLSDGLELLILGWFFALVAGAFLAALGVFLALNLSSFSS